MTSNLDYHLNNIARKSGAYAEASMGLATLKELADQYSIDETKDTAYGRAYGIYYGIKINLSSNPILRDDEDFRNAFGQLQKTSLVQLLEQEFQKGNIPQHLKDAKRVKELVGVK